MGGGLRGELPRFLFNFFSKPTQMLGRFIVSVLTRSRAPKSVPKSPKVAQNDTFCPYFVGEEGARGPFRRASARLYVTFGNSPKGENLGGPSAPLSLLPPTT